MLRCGFAMRDEVISHWLQLFPEEERGTALDHLAARLQPNGLFLSRSHDNRSRLPKRPVHHVERFFRDRGWLIWSGETESPNPTGRLAWLEISTS